MQSVQYIPCKYSRNDKDSLDNAVNKSLSSLIANEVSYLLKNLINYSLGD